MMTVLLHHILQLLSCVREDHHSGSNLLAKFMQFFVSFFNFLVEGLIFNLQLLKIDQMKAVCELFLLLKDFLFVC
jgi:hypothetical protein